jgi:hypothetical protein
VPCTRQALRLIGAELTTAIENGLFAALQLR